jgi:hypothetical protein
VLGGYGVYNTGDILSVLDSTITASSGGAITEIKTSDTGYIRIGYSSTTSLALTGSGGTGIFNSASDMYIINSTIKAGESGSIISQGITTANAYIGSEGSAIINTGDTGIQNSGDNAQLENCIIEGASSGYMRGTALTTVYIGVASVSFPGNATIYSGGSGIYNSGSLLQVKSCAISAGSSGQIVVPSGTTTCLIGRGSTNPAIVAIGTGGTGLYNTGNIHNKSRTASQPGAQVDQ